jgi:hypothetical protein
MRFVVALSLCAVAASAFAQDQLVSPDEIKAKWVGKKVFARSAAGQLADFVMMADGSASVSVANFSDTGTWRLWEKGYCARWQKIRAGTEACLTVVRRGGDMFVLNPDGSVNSQILSIPE